MSVKTYIKTDKWPSAARKLFPHINGSLPQHKKHAMPRLPKPAPEPDADDEKGLELPVAPDEGTPLIPDDERVVNVPS